MSALRDSASWLLSSLLFRLKQRSREDYVKGKSSHELWIDAH